MKKDTAMVRLTERAVQKVNEIRAAEGVAAELALRVQVVGGGCSGFRYDLFFDEATSALDNRSQAAVSENLERLQATRIVIAHRLSTIMNADRIYVLDGGSIVQAGSYGELMRQEGLFAQMARRQLIGERREERGLIVRSGSIHG